jgi:ribonuclease R
MHAPELSEQDPTTVAGYREIMRGLSAPEQTLPLRTMVNRLMTRAELCNESAPHMGMALEQYTNCTSPLRKYVDFLVHLQIKSVLHGNEANLVDPQTLADLAKRLATIRSATQEAERWLASKYLARQAAANEGITFKARIMHVNSSGFNARLDDNGLEGFVDLRKDPEKFSYDKWTASLTSTTRRFALDNTVEVTFLGADAENMYQSRFALVAGCGLKEPPAASAPADS